MEEQNEKDKVRALTVRAAEESATSVDHVGEVWKTSELSAACSDSTECNSMQDFLDLICKEFLRETTIIRVVMFNADILS